MINNTKHFQRLEGIRLEDWSVWDLHLPYLGQCDPHNGHGLLELLLAGPRRFCNYLPHITIFGI